MFHAVFQKVVIYVVCANLFFSVRVCWRVLTSFAPVLLQEELLKLKDIEGSLAIFCLATYGEGDPTDNAIDLYEWLKDGGHDLTGLRYTVST